MKVFGVAALALLAACGAAASGSGLVDGRLDLPKHLREVSGLVAVDERTVVCVQDEKGALWFVDLRGEATVRSEPFGPAGDYEALARADGAWPKPGASSADTRTPLTSAT
jgi:hypothetical protein